MSYKSFKGTIEPFKYNDEDCYLIKADVGFVFRQVRNYIPPFIPGKVIECEFHPTESPKFGKTHCLVKIGLKGAMDMFDHDHILVASRRILIHGGKTPDHSSGCWLPFSNGSFISGYRYNSHEVIHFELECIES